MQQAAGDAQPRRLVRPHRGREAVRAAEVDRDEEAAGQGRGEPGQGADPRQHAGVLQAHPRGRRRAPDHRRPPADRPDRGRRCRRHASARRRRGRAARPDPVLPADPGDRPPASAGGLRVRPRRPQGRRRRQRRHPRLDPAHARPRRPGPAVPAGQGGPGVGAGAVRRQEQVHQPRAARRRRPAPDAGGQRHLPRLAARHRGRRAGPRLLHAPAARLEGLGRRRHHVRHA